MTFLLAGALISAVGFVLLSIPVFSDAPALRDFDARAARLAVPFKTPGWSAVFGVVTFFGSVWGVMLVSGLLLFVTDFAALVTFRGIVAVAGSAAVVQIVKVLIARIRPEKLAWRISELEFSYPSGHTAAATSLYGFIAVLLFAATGSAFVWVAAIAVIALIAFSRMALSVHYATDVLGGLLLGLCGIFVAFALPF